MLGLKVCSQAASDILLELGRMCVFCCLCVPRRFDRLSDHSQGCEELLTPFVRKPRPWSAVRVKEYGYTRLHILNGTHMHIQQVSDDQVCRGSRAADCRPGPGCAGAGWSK